MTFNTKPSRHEHDAPTKDMVVGALLQGASFREVAEQFSIPKSTCYDIFAKFLKTGSTQNKPRSGRPRKLDPYAHRLLIRIARNNRKLSLRELGKLVTPTICSKTVHDELARDGLWRRRVRKV
ncbi:hypothetical protein BDN72DRAFT_782770, partial [Pluteus cervinus]